MLIAQIVIKVVVVVAVARHTHVDNEEIAPKRRRCINNKQIKMFNVFVTIDRSNWQQTKKKEIQKSNPNRRKVSNGASSFALDRISNKHKQTNNNTNTNIIITRKKLSTKRSKKKSRKVYHRRAHLFKYRIEQCPNGFVAIEIITYFVFCYHKK